MLIVNCNNETLFKYKTNDIQIDLINTINIVHEMSIQIGKSVTYIGVQISNIFGTHPLRHGNRK